MPRKINKYEMLKPTIYQLYSKEGRSKSYISRLLHLNRKCLLQYINDIWKLPAAEPHRYMKPSTEKFLNKNKQLIKSRLDKDIPIKTIAKELGCAVSLIDTVAEYDPVLKKAKADYVRRIHEHHIDKVNKKINKSSRCYEIKEIQGEYWKEILGYKGYYVSNMGRIKHYIKSYDTFALLKPEHNCRTNREYIKIGSKNLSFARIVAHAFVNGYSSERNTVNHIDGDVENNSASNLEWVSQSDNNKHSYSCLGRKKVNVGMKGRKYKHFIYKGKYEFKTVAAFARFIGKSETQARRYLDEADKHDLKILA